MKSLDVLITGQIQGPIWMPPVTCTKQFTLHKHDLRFAEGRPTLRDMVLRATNDGDFQSTTISWGELVLTSLRVFGPVRVTRERRYDLRKFPSIADCMTAEDKVVEVYE